MRRRGFTLIEQVVSVALLAIVFGVGSFALTAQRARATDLVLRERARQLLELEAGARLAKVDSDRVARVHLLSSLPEGNFAEERTSFGTRSLASGLVSCA